MKLPINITHKQSCKNAGAAVTPKYAFTLIELLVYMAILGFVIVVAGRVFSDATGMRVRSQNMLASAEEAGKVSALLKEDISQMGAKTWGYSSASSYKVASKVYQNYQNPATASADFSSFNLFASSTDPTKYDNLSFKKIIYKPDGTCNYVAQIEWSVNGDVLNRKCTFVQDAECASSLPTLPTTTECSNTGVSIEMARNVTEFRLFPSVPGATASSNAADFSKKYEFEQFPVSPNYNYKLISRHSNAGLFTDQLGSQITLSGFSHLTAAPDNANTRTEAYLSETGGSALNNCKAIAFDPDEEYSVSFDMLCPSVPAAPDYNKMLNFQPGKDHLSIGLRKTDGKAIDGVPDFLFYPPQNYSSITQNYSSITDEVCTSQEKKRRRFKFSVPKPATGTTVSACIALTVALYSDAYNGTLVFDNFRIIRNIDKAYHFEENNVSSAPAAGYTLDVTKKAAVKAFKLKLGVKKKNEVNSVETVIPVPNNGVIPGGS
jgi:type II secretory pathway pseudopilin PulG